ncbi:MAG: hypothetical protein EOP83_28370 [Verrucomicrobiaceae bacterium]|nr:MAG: hypothetical protein EOP83_28370 [Verrucomicrobiaceae bacterium]
MTDIRLTGVSGGSIGNVDFNRQGRLTFVPSGTGNFQLRTSIDLQAWSDQGVAFPGTAGTPLIIETGTPGGEPKRFFRVESR